MDAAFMLMEQHRQTPRKPNAAGKLVLSRLRPGRSVISAPAPSLKMVIDGEEIYQIDGRSVRVQPGQFLYLDAGTACVGTNNVETTGLCLILPHAPARTPRGVEGHDPVLGRALVLSNRTSAMGRSLERYAKAIAREPESGHRLVGELLGRVAHAIEEPLAESRTAIEALGAVKASTRHALFQRLERARGFLHANDDRNVTLSELAEIAHLSQFHLARFFRLAFGAPPIAYHRTLRLARAARYLADDDGTVAEAAEIAGYSDAVSLCHAFRRHFGTTPKGFQQEALRAVA